MAVTDLYLTRTRESALIFLAYAHSFLIPVLHALPVFYYKSIGSWHYYRKVLSYYYSSNCLLLICITI